MQFRQLTRREIPAGFSSHVKDLVAVLRWAEDGRTVPASVIP